MTTVPTTPTAPTLSTERLTLRTWHVDEHDAQSLFAYAKNPEIGPRAGWQPHKNLEES